MKSATSSPSADCEFCTRDAVSHPLFLYICYDEKTHTNLRLGLATNPDKRIDKLNAKSSNKRRGLRFQRLAFIGPFKTELDKRIAKEIRRLWQPQSQEKTLQWLLQLLHAYDDVQRRVAIIANEEEFKRVWNGSEKGG